MVEKTVFRGIIEFLQQIGIYDVILPFLLVFTIVFAILEKTKVLGTEKIEGKEYTKKNINAMVAFVVSFLVIASTKLVAVINEATANIVLLLFLAVFFLLLVGSFFKEGEDVFLQGRWRTFFMFIMFLGIVLIFLQALGWLTSFWDFLTQHWETQWVGTLILLVVIILFILYITKSKEEAPKPKTTEEQK
jgi:small-conductance mechanosensitive channel